MKVGIVLPQHDSDPQILRGSVQQAKEAGIDSIWVADHLMGRNNSARPILEGWVSLAAVAAETDLQLGTLVLRAGIRPPRLTAEMFATAASIAAGGVIAGLGLGDRSVLAEQSSYGIPFATRAHRMDHTRQTIELIRERAPSVKIWVGGTSQEAMSLAAQADGWNLWGRPEDFAATVERIRRVARSSEFEVSWGGSFPGEHALDSLKQAGADHIVVAVGTSNFADRIASLRAWARA